MTEEIFRRSLEAAKPLLDCLAALHACGEDNDTGERLNYSHSQPQSGGQFPTLVVTYGAPDIIPQQFAEDLGMENRPGVPPSWVFGAEGKQKPGFHAPGVYIVMKDGKYDVSFCSRKAGFDPFLGVIYTSSEEMADLELKQVVQLFAPW